MRFHFTTIPAHEGDSAAEAALNQFLASHRIVDVERHLITDGPRSFWAVCVQWTETPDRATPPDARKARVDYRDQLSPEEFAVFAKLRALRKTVAEREAVPPYAVFTNDQLAAMVRQRTHTLADLARIEGVGQARVEKHGAAFLELLRALPDAPKPPDGVPTAA